MIYNCMMSANLNSASSQNRTDVYDALEEAGWIKIEKHEIDVSTVWVRSFTSLPEKLSREEREMVLKDNINEALVLLDIDPKVTMNMVIQFGNREHFTFQLSARPSRTLQIR